MVSERETLSEMDGETGERGRRKGLQIRCQGAESQNWAGRDLDWSDVQKHKLDTQTYSCGFGRYAKRVGH